jgi:hypothetical protein
MTVNLRYRGPHSETRGGGRSLGNVLCHEQVNGAVIAVLGC